MKPLRMTVNAAADSAEFYVYDVIGKDYFGDGVTAKALAAALKSTEGVANINVRINSPGGDVFEGMAIYSLLSTSGRTVTVDIDGLAASAASIVAMAGDEIRIAAGGDLMIHNAWTSGAGNAVDFRKTADLLDQISGQLAGIYVSRTGNDLKDVLSMMDAETWLTADDALAKGFVTSVTEAKKMAASIDPAKFKFRNVPTHLVEPPSDSLTPEEFAYQSKIQQFEQTINELRESNAKGKDAA